MKKVIIASKNEGKIKEIKEYLRDMPVIIESVKDYKYLPEIIEDGVTFEDNAIKKAKEIARYTQTIALADDSGLEVDCLCGKPGVLSARFGGENLTDEERNMFLLEMIKNECDGLSDNRSARFVCVIAVATHTGIVKTARGECEGTISYMPRGKYGFGYDPIFIPAGYNATFAELGMAVKNKLSHRAKALEKVKDILNEMLYGERLI
jgi:XTP/dITP diphosphohydrolase